MFIIPIEPIESIEAENKDIGIPYDGIIYDTALYSSQKDGLRSRAYYYYLFNNSDHIVLEYRHLTAGAGLSFLTKGTWEGSFEDKIIMAFPNDDSITKKELTFSKLKITDNKGNDYSTQSVDYVINKINYDKLLNK